MDEFQAIWKRPDTYPHLTEIQMLIQEATNPAPLHLPAQDPPSQIISDGGGLSQLSRCRCGLPNASWTWPARNSWLEDCVLCCLRRSTCTMLLSSLFRSNVTVRWTLLVTALHQIAHLLPCRLRERTWILLLHSQGQPELACSCKAQLLMPTFGRAQPVSLPPSSRGPRAGMFCFRTCRTTLHSSLTC